MEMYNRKTWEEARKLAKKAEIKNKSKYSPFYKRAYMGKLLVENELVIVKND